MMLNQEQLQDELDGDYHPVFVELKKLEQEYPGVQVNQEHVIEDEFVILVNTYASLLYAAQDEAEEIKTPKEIRDALKALEGVTGFRSLITDLVGSLFPATVFIVERLYFQNRACVRYFQLPAKERQDKLKKVDLNEWIYPPDRLERIRDLARAIWRQHVLETTKR